MYLAAFVPFRSVVARSRAAFRTGLKRAAIKDGSRWLLLTPCRHAQELAQVVDHHLEHACLEPALSSADRPPPTVAAHWAACERRAPARTIQRRPLSHVTQRILPLWGLFAHQGQVRSDKGPLVVAHI